MADGIKTYKIVINGITESIDAIDSLNRQLDVLSKKIDELSSKTIKIATSTSPSSSTGGGSNKSSSKSSLTEEEKLERQIAQIDEKREAYSKSIYQNYLAAKDVLKETLNDQKQIAAQERLQANNYTNTMQGLKQKLADIKNVMQTTDIGSDMFKKYTKEANEITNKLKELEQATGQFGRNVGNYASAADGFNKITVAVGNTVREYDNYKQAVKELKAERFQLSQSIGTEAEAYKNVDIALKKLESDYKDLDKSSAFMDDMLDTIRSVTAIASIGQGLSTLFGIDDADFQKTVQKIVSLSIVLQGVETVMKNIQTDEGYISKGWKNIKDVTDSLGKSIEKAGAYVASFIANLRESDIGEQGFVKVEGAFNEMGHQLYELSENAPKRLKRFETAIKAIGVAAKWTARVIMTAFSAGLLLILPEIISFFGKVKDNFDSTRAAAEHAAEGVNKLTKALEARLNALSSSYLKGVIDDEEYLARVYKAQSRAIEQQIELLKARAKEMAEEEDSWFSPTKHNTEFTSQSFTEPITVEYGKMFGTDLKYTVNDVEQLENAWKECNQAINEGKDYLSKWGSGLVDWIGSLWVTVNDTREIMRGLGNIKLSDFVAEFQAVNKKVADGTMTTKEYAKELRKLKVEMDNDDILSTVIANLDKYIPDEKVRETVQNIINEITRLDDAFNMTSEGQIHYWNQVRIDAMKDGAEKTMAQIKENERHEVVEYGKTEEQISLIQAKYNRQRLDAQARYNKERSQKAKDAASKLKAIEEELRKLEIEGMKEGLDKIIAQLEEEKRQRLIRAKEMGDKTGALRVKIEEVYNKKIIDARKKWANDYAQVYSNMWMKIQQIYNKNSNILLENEKQDIELRYKNLKESVSKMLDDAPYNYTPNTPENAGNKKEGEYTDKLREEYKKRIANRQDYYNKILSLANEKEKELYENELRSLSGQLSNELYMLDSSYKSQEKEMKNNLDKGIISQSEYNTAHERLVAERTSEEAAIVEKYSKLQLERQKTYEETRKENTITAANSIIQEYQNVMDKIKGISTTPMIQNAWGLPNVVKINRTCKKVKELYETLLGDIEKSIRDLDRKKSLGEITEEDYEKAKGALNSLKESINAGMGEIEDNNRNRIAAFIQSSQKYISAGLDSFNQIMSAVWDAQDTQFDKEQEALDKENEMIQDALNKQDDMIEQHKNKVESIEDELANSRGARRQHLIDQLNAEMEAERRAQKEKQRLQKQEELNKKKQDKLELERKKAEYNRNVLQAAVNGAMAVTYAMMNTWPVPAIPMMLLAASTTATQLAIMAANKPYAKGGILDGGGGVAVGPRHRDGGIPVLGGRASIEGGEFITNRVTTQYNAPLLEYINSKKKRVDVTDLIDFYTGNKVRSNISAIKTKYADGGALPALPNNLDIRDQISNVIVNQDNRPIYVTVTDIQNKMDDVKYVKTLAGLEG